MKKSPLHHPFDLTTESEFTFCPAAFAVSLGADIYAEFPGDLVKEPEFTCCPAAFLGTDIFITVTGRGAKPEELPGDLVKEPEYTCCPADFLGTDIFTTITGEVAKQEQLKQVVVLMTVMGKQEDMEKIVKKSTESKPRQKSKKKDEEAVGEETEESIELNRRIDKFRRRRERSKQLKKREHDKKLYDAKKLAAKLARTL